VTELKLVAIDTSKHVFTVHGVNDRGEIVLRRELRRGPLVAFFRKLPPTDVVLEACGGSHRGSYPASVGTSRAVNPAAIRQTVRQTRQERLDRC
jgi:transposase